MKIEIANLTVEIKNKFNFLEDMCKNYLSQNAPDFCVEVGNDEIEKERSLNEIPFEDGYLESLCAYRQIAERLPEYNALLIHGATIEVNGEAFIFLAKSGVGKSTHIKLWRKLLGEKVKIVNGDKPIIRFIDGVPYACGTPWAGKEKWERNVKVPLKAICFLARGEKDEIRKISEIDAVTKLIKQTYIPKTASRAKTALELLDKLLKTTELFELFCTPEISAAEVSYKALTNN